MNQGHIYTIKHSFAEKDTIEEVKPVLVLNGGHDTYLRLAIVLPIIDWRDYLAENPFFVSLEPHILNGISKRSMVDCYQIRAIEHERFGEKIGAVSSDIINQVKKSISLILDIDSEHCK